MTTNFWSRVFSAFFDPRMYERGRDFTYFIDQDAKDTKTANGDLFRFVIAQEIEDEEDDAITVDNFKCIASFSAMNNGRTARYKTLENAFCKYLALYPDARKTIKRTDIFFFFEDKGSKVKARFTDVLGAIKKKLSSAPEDTAALYERLMKNIENAEKVTHKKTKARPSKKVVVDDDDAPPPTQETPTQYDSPALASAPPPSTREVACDAAKKPKKKRRIQPKTILADEEDDDPETTIVENVDDDTPPPKPASTKQLPHYPIAMSGRDDDPKETRTDVPKRKVDTAPLPVVPAAVPAVALGESRKRKLPDTEDRSAEEHKKKSAKTDVPLTEILQHMDRNTEKHLEMVKSMCAAMMEQTTSCIAAMTATVTSIAASRAAHVSIADSRDTMDLTSDDIDLFGERDDVPDVPQSMELDVMSGKRKRKTRGLKLSPEDDDDCADDPEFDPAKESSSEESEVLDSENEDAKALAIDRAYKGRKENHDNCSEVETSADEYSDDPTPTDDEVMLDDDDGSEEEEEEEEDKPPSRKKKSAAQKSATTQRIPASKKKTGTTDNAQVDDAPVAVVVKETFDAPAKPMRSIQDVINTTKVRRDALDL